jgi:hypothetical protein
MGVKGIARVLQSGVVAGGGAGADRRSSRLAIRWSSRQRSVVEMMGFERSRWGGDELGFIFVEREEMFLAFQEPNGFKLFFLRTKWVLTCVTRWTNAWNHLISWWVFFQGIGLPCSWKQAPKSEFQGENFRAEFTAPSSAGLLFAARKTVDPLVSVVTPAFLRGV